MKLRVSTFAVILLLASMFLFKSCSQAHAAPHSIKLTWSADTIPPGSNAATVVEYVLQSAPTVAGPFVDLPGATALTVTTFTDGGLGPNVTKCYQLLAFTHPPSGVGLVDSKRVPMPPPPVCATTPIDAEIPPNVPSGLAAVAQ